MQRASQIQAVEINRAYVMAFRRLSKPALLRAVTTLIPKKPERKQHFYEVLSRTGEEGAATQLDLNLVLAE